MPSIFQLINLIRKRSQIRMFRELLLDAIRDRHIHTAALWNSRLYELTGFKKYAPMTNEIDYEDSDD